MECVHCRKSHTTPNPFSEDTCIDCLIGQYKAYEGNLDTLGVAELKEMEVWYNNMLYKIRSKHSSLL